MLTLESWDDMADELEQKTRSFFSYLLLGLSPIGAIVFFIVFSMTGVCRGALGSGVSCNLPIIDGYIETIGAFLEASCLLAGSCLIWGAAALFVWVMVLVRLCQVTIIRLR